MLFLSDNMYRLVSGPTVRGSWFKDYFHHFPDCYMGRYEMKKPDGSWGSICGKGPMRELNNRFCRVLGYDHGEYSVMGSGTPGITLDDCASEAGRFYAEQSRECDSASTAVSGCLTILAPGSKQVCWPCTHEYGAFCIF